MIRRSLILTCLLLLPCPTYAQDSAAKAEEAFSAICSAAMDGKPDIAALATSFELVSAGGIKDAITIGKMSFRNFNSPQTKQNFVITTTTYADAQEMECQSTIQVPIARGELENLARSLKLDGDFFPTSLSSVTIGRWKRPGNKPLVLVTMVSNAATTVLKMQRIEVLGSNANTGKK